MKDSGKSEVTGRKLENRIVLKIMDTYEHTNRQAQNKHIVTYISPNPGKAQVIPTEV